MVAVDPQTGRVLRDTAGAPITYPLDDTDLVDRMGRNTSYMIHPQEVIADNFALLMEWRATGVQPGVVPGGPGEGFPVNDVPLLEMTTDPRAITRPDDSLLTYYVFVSLCALLAFPTVFIPLFIRSRRCGTSLTTKE